MSHSAVENFASIFMIIDGSHADRSMGYLYNEQYSPPPPRSWHVHVKVYMHFPHPACNNSLNPDELCTVSPKFERALSTAR